MYEYFIYYGMGAVTFVDVYILAHGIEYIKTHRHAQPDYKSRRMRMYVLRTRRYVCYFRHEIEC